MNTTCEQCGHEQEISPAALLGSLPKTMTPAAILARQINGLKGGRPTKPKHSIVKEPV